MDLKKNKILIFFKIFKKLKKNWISDSKKNGILSVINMGFSIEKLNELLK